MKFRRYYDDVKERVSQEFVEPSLTQQRYFIMNDINSIIDADIVRINKAEIYGVQDDLTYEGMMNLKLEVDRRWSDLSIEEKRYYRNKSNYIKSISNIKNYEEIIKGEDVFEQRKLDNVDNSSSAEPVEPQK